MAKPGPLGEVEKFFIQGNYQRYTVDQLSKKLNRPKNTVEKFISELKIESVTSVKSDGKTNLFAQNGKGSTVMTPAASELGDEIRKSNSGGLVDRRCTTTIK